MQTDKIHVHHVCVGLAQAHPNYVEIADDIPFN